MKKVHIQSQLPIEHFKEHIHVDFANPFLGGGVLSSGLIQEEIRFITFPECIVSMIFFEKLEDNEAAIIYGAEQFSQYKGYGKSFQFNGDFTEKYNVIQGEKNIIDTVLVAIDAIHFQQEQINLQYNEFFRNREIIKALAGFEGIKIEEQNNFANQKKSIVTGNWGCGYFKGDKELKFMIQWICASLSQRDMIFCTYNDKDQEFRTNEIYEILKDKYTDQVYLIFKEYYQLQKQAQGKQIISLFNFIIQLAH
ncbi:poly adp-ribose glycohydrolase, putative [Ichthyophthirius multifiliis]|uniref:Poly adp-ribose glycohydrolase, putative n=1 Tax=Ichthyophthirius multifiliis TaxID=5932 RepID=G0R662_ICHMU|nr:poly adp-ribose glycohydrolase, putative [Ichthyophthirius multifiliis]EGR27026.1 poly adp-ribose glycohydrolase, putative [Ichthyophthirius multifiliis]|eukprot:XP_004023910.1 poly adp-ribose glycohydrolase, putative [Ichthyophthirius multifiliis]